MTASNTTDAQPDQPADHQPTDPETIRELATRRGFYHPANESYGGVAGFYTYGPAGAALKRNVEDAWRDRFITREGAHEIDSPTIVPEPVFEASGHLDSFDDFLVACPDCDARHRADHLVEDHADIADAESLPPREIEALILDYDVRCPDCGGPLADQPVRDFGLMFETAIGPGDGRPAYLRPETAQGTLVEFPRLKEYARNQLPFAVAQVGRGYRNEISPRRSLLRLRELTMAELQRFVHPDHAEDDNPPLSRVGDLRLRLYPAPAQVGEGDDPAYETVTVREAAAEWMEPWLAYYLGVACEWLERVGVDPARIRFRQHRAGELAHYATDCWDAEALVAGVSEPSGSEARQAVEPSDGEWIELAGIAFRADHDLAHHADHTKNEYAVFDRFDEPRTVEEPVVDPDMSVLGPEFGDRAPRVVEALEGLAAENPASFEATEDSDAFDAPEIVVELDGEQVSVPREAVDFRVERRRVHGEHVRPHVFEPSFGIDRVVYAVLAHSHRRDDAGAGSDESDDSDDELRARLAFDPTLAPTAAAVFPLREEAADRAHELVRNLRARGLRATYDDSGSIGRRYRRQDEVGTPFCVTLDEQTEVDEAATLRERDSTEQVRVPLDEMPEILLALRRGERAFEDVQSRFE